MIQTIVRCSVRGSCSSPAYDSVPSASFGCNMYLKCGSVTSHCHSCNKTGRWPALFLTLTLHLWRSLHYFTLLYITLHYLGHFSLHYSTCVRFMVAGGDLFVTPPLWHPASVAVRSLS